MFKVLLEKRNQDYNRKRTSKIRRGRFKDEGSDDSGDEDNISIDWEYFINLNPKVLRFVKNRWKELDREVVLQALRKDIIAIYSLQALDREMALLVVETNPLALKYEHGVWQNDKEIVLKAISQNKNLLVYACDSIIEEVLRNRELIEYSQEDVINLVLNGVKEKPSLFNYLPEHMKTNHEFVIKLVELDTRISEFIPESLKQNREFLMELVKYDRNAFYNCKDMDLRGSRQFLLNALSTYRFSLSSAPSHLKDDKEFVMECLTAYPADLDEASSRLRDDEQVVELVLKEFNNASNRLKDDKDFVMKHIEEFPQMYQSLSQRLKSDKEIILKCASGGGVISNGYFFHDDDFVLELVERNAHIVETLGKITPEFAKKCIERNGFCYHLLKQHSMVTESDELDQLAALSRGYLADKHTEDIRPTYGFHKIKTRTSYEDREIVDSWIKKRLEKQYDGLYISLSSPIFVKGKFVNTHIKG
ncbi:predicted protein [Naegleria gruberi]|uniref:Predicted protein n=1 Tax=Naegleria gruberi TaxID=5762 RepID=D2VUT5_NAEGR|nr:uncharacterized protein NAEGRDRAFT_72778 [Naegleria gruberi]EFC39314.1 predicted protein [Naegleria gruberi]|eukprot:XP_002672058.1 predicted protein [Naegleria gruberi strain NEG-M]